jgi:transcriptional regulator with XRE-family HTH domain
MRLTRGEGWWLRRRRADMTATEMAEALSISQDRLRRWEHDREAAPLPPKLTSPLTDGEWCALQRRRRGLTLPEVAARLKVSRMTLWKAEHDRTSGVLAVRRFYERLGPARPSTAAPVQVAEN